MADKMDSPTSKIEVKAGGGKKEKKIEKLKGVKCKEAGKDHDIMDTLGEKKSGVAKKPAPVDVGKEALGKGGK